MSVVCFGSLKGGVGKTSLSINVAHAFASTGATVLLVDLDPMGHASRFFRINSAGEGASVESALARLFIGEEWDLDGVDKHCILARAHDQGLRVVDSVRDGLDLVASGPELRHFLWGRGARIFKTLFPLLIQEFTMVYDHVVIDTPPDFNVLMRNAIGVSDMVVVPVDSSAMSIHCLEEIVNSAAHIKKPRWAIIRSMVNKQASRVQKMTRSRIEENLAIDETGVASNSEEDNSPIYLLNSVVYRSELQNRLSFLGKTAFDDSSALTLKSLYEAVALEIENLPALNDEDDEVEMDRFRMTLEEASETEELHV
jgi:chromosome partitioning protein